MKDFSIENRFHDNNSEVLIWAVTPFESGNPNLDDFSAGCGLVKISYRKQLYGTTFKYSIDYICSGSVKLKGETKTTHLAFSNVCTASDTKKTLVFVIATPREKMVSDLRQPGDVFSQLFLIR